MILKLFIEGERICKKDLIVFVIWINIYIYKDMLQPRPTKNSLDEP